MKDFLRVYWPFILLAAAGITLTLRFVEPPPPSEITLAVGPTGGAYRTFAERYQRAMSEAGVEVTLMETAGSVDNLRMLVAGDVDMALAQGGLAMPGDSEVIASLGGLFHEPFWVFTRDELGLFDMEALKSARVAIGQDGSGTRELTLQLRTEWGTGWGLSSAEPLAGEEAARALISGKVDAAIFVAAIEAPYIQTLLMENGISLLPFPRAHAIARRNPALAPVTLLRGVVDLGEDVPARDIPLIAPVAQMMVRKDLHPAIHSLFMEMAFEIHGQGTLLAPAGAFPDATFTDLPLSPEARRYFERGPSTLRRWFSFSVANFLERAWILMIPLLTLLIPLIRAAPPIYRWRVRRRIYVWYSVLRDLETQGRAATTPDERQSVLATLKRLQEDVGEVEVPLSYTDDLYRLRSHIVFVGDLIKSLELESAIPSRVA